MIRHDPDDEVRATLVAPSRRVAASRVQLSATRTSTGFHVDASYRIELDPLSTGRYVLLESWRSSLPILRCSSNLGPVRDLLSELNQRLLYIELPENSDGLPSIDVDVTIEWNRNAGDRERQPWFVASDSVPTPVLRDGDPPLQRTEFFLDREMPSDFAITGVQRDQVAWNPVSNPQLDVVLLPNLASSRIGATDIIFAGDTSSRIEHRNEGAIIEELRRNLDDLSELLGVSPTLRLGLYADADPISPLAGHSLLGGKPDLLGFDGKFGYLKGGAIGTMAQTWWGGCIGIPGFLGLAISLGIGRALALRITDLRQTPAYFDSLRGVAERGAAKVTEPGRRSANKLAYEIGLALYRGLAERGSVRAELQAMTNEYWGQEVPATLVLQRLAAVGVAPPNGLRGLA